MQVQDFIRKIRDGDKLSQLQENFNQIIAGQDRKEFLISFSEIFDDIIVALQDCYKNVGRVCFEDIAKFLKNYCGFVSQISCPNSRNFLLRQMCQKSLKVIIESLQETEKEKYLAHSLALAVVLKENCLEPEKIIKLLLNNTRQDLSKEKAALIALSKIAEVYQIRLHARLQPDEVQQIKQFVLDNNWDHDFINEIEQITSVMKFNIDQPKLKSVHILEEQIHVDNIVAAAYDQQSCTFFSGGYDSKIVYWGCSGEIETVKNEINICDQEIVSLDWCDKNQLLFGCTRCLGSTDLSPVLFGCDLDGNQRFCLQSSSEALYACKSIAGTDRCLTSETVSSGGKKSYVVKVYNVEQFGSCNSLRNLPPENIIVGHSNRVSDIQVDDTNNNIILTTAFDRRAKVWDLRQPSSPVLNLGCYTQNRGRSSSNERAHHNYVHSGDLAISKHTVVTAGQDFVLKNWDVRNNLRPVIEYNLDDSAVIKVRLNKIGGTVPYASVCAASTMSKLFMVNLQGDSRKRMLNQVDQLFWTATRDFVWVKKQREQFLFATQNEGVIAKYVAVESH